ncbi:Gfo/Idh/MocA family oxidoreductase [bacterium]|nr:MAG: Gfo/Idh/MocA family oxidoreductase [bacterium]
MSQQRLRIGFIGLQAERGWGLSAHLPALRALADGFEVTAVANSSLESSTKAAQALGVPHAFASASELAQSPEVDIVVVTVKVPHHFELVKAAIEAGKHVYCEWPLGNGLEEAKILTDLAQKKGVLAVVGTQARVAPEIIHLRNLVAEGYVGEILSTTLIGASPPWGGSIDKPNAYTYDRANGANLLTIPFGHTIAALFDVLGPIAELSARLDVRRKTATLVETGESIPATSPDQVLVAGTLESGAPISAHYYGGESKGDGLIWRIVGTQGELQLTGPGGHSQLVQLELFGAQGETKKLEKLPLPKKLADDATDGPIVGNVRRVYQALAADLRDDTQTAPSFADAVKVHQVIAAIEAAAESKGFARPADF